MKPWSVAVRDALVSGTAAAALSAAVLAAMGRRQNRNAAAPINAVSHWFWGRESEVAERVDARHTLVGYLTHNAAAVFWAVFFERWFGDRARHDRGAALVGGAVTAALACTVDYTITPKRFTPGYEKRLSKGALLLTYAAFGLGLAMTRWPSHAAEAHWMQDTPY